jgi:hypothetical protein
VTLRALRLPLAELEPLVAPGGRVLVFGPPALPAPGWREGPAEPRGRSGPTVFLREA